MADHRLPGGARHPRHPPGRRRRSPGGRPGGGAHPRRGLRRRRGPQHGQDSALDLAVEQAVLRRNIADSFVNLGRRNQNLLGRQLDFITELETNETNPDTLSNLFRSTTSPPACAATPSRCWCWRASAAPQVGRPRAAHRRDPGGVGQVEDYQRVTVRGVEPATIVGAAAADLAHLLAELIENALVFAPDQTVDIRGRNRHDGYTLAIIDSGLGMPPPTSRPPTAAWPARSRSRSPRRSTWATTWPATWPPATGSRSTWTTRPATGSRHRQAPRQPAHHRQPGRGPAAGAGLHSRRARCRPPRPGGRRRGRDRPRFQRRRRQQRDRGRRRSHRETSGARTGATPRRWRPARRAASSSALGGAPDPEAAGAHARRRSARQPERRRHEPHRPGAPAGPGAPGARPPAGPGGSSATGPAPPDPRRRPCRRRPTAHRPPWPRRRGRSVPERPSAGPPAA